MEPTAIRTILVEDEPAMRASLQNTLSSNIDFHVSAVCETLADGIKAVASTPADVLITDLKLPDGHGLDLIRYSRKSAPQMEILVISVLGDEESVVSAIRAGASGFLLKDTRALDVIKSVRELLDGKSPISTSVARHIIQVVQQVQKQESDKNLLTAREMDILWGIAKGFTYNDVAEKLGISSNTVPNYVKNIYRKLEVNSRGEAVFEAIQRGLITIT